MKDLYTQERIIFNRFADWKYDKKEKGITVETVRKLLGDDAIRYATNAESPKIGYPILRKNDTLTKEGFLEAFRFFWMQEILRGEHDAYTTPDYLERFGIKC